MNTTLDRRASALTRSNNSTRPYTQQHAFLRLFPRPEREGVYDLFWCAASTLHPPDICLRHVLLMCASILTEPSILDGEALLSAKRISVNVLRYPSLAQDFISRLMVIEGEQAR